MRIPTPLVLLGVALLGACTLNRGLAQLNARPADLEYLRATFGGLELGLPERAGELVRVPVQFGAPPPARPRAGVVVFRWRASLEERTALVTAEVTQGGDGVPGAAAIELEDVEAGPLALVYLDSDGRRTPLGSVAVPP